MSMPMLARKLVAVFFLVFCASAHAELCSTWSPAVYHSNVIFPVDNSPATVAARTKADAWAECEAASGAHFFDTDSGGYAQVFYRCEDYNATNVRRVWDLARDSGPYPNYVCTPYGLGNGDKQYIQYGASCPSPTIYDPAKHTCVAPRKGCEKCGAVGSIDPGDGNNAVQDTDFDIGWLPYTRYYNSAGGNSAVWSTSLSSNVVSDGTSAIVSRPDGNRLKFVLSSGSWIADADVTGSLKQLFDSQGQPNGWAYQEKDSRVVETYDVEGRLAAISRSDGSTLSVIYNGGVTTGGPDDYVISSVVDQSGRKWSFQYNTDRKISSVTDPAGSAYQYSYGASGNLVKVVYPGGDSKSYLYNESSNTGGTNLPYALTGILDETGQRYATYSYDATGRAISTEHASGAAKYTVTYNADGSVAIGTPSGSTDQRTFVSILGVRHAATKVETCTSGCSARTNTFSYDSNGRSDLITDPLGSITDSDFSARGLLTQRIEATNDTSGAKRTIQTDWHAAFAVPTERRTYDAAGILVAKQAWTYNGRGQLLTASRIDPTTGVTGTTSAIYCEQADVDAGTCPLVGLVRSVNGPRTDVSDVTSYSYYASDDPSCAPAPTTCPHRRGDLWKVTNALGHVTEILTYDGAGRVLSVKDPNGVVTDMTYSPRGWLAVKKMRGPYDTVETDDAITRIDYWPTGLVKQITQPDGSYTSYVYDTAHRLTDVTDNVGNTIHYTLDTTGNRTGEDTKDSSATLTRTLSRVYNQLGQMQSQRDSALHAITFTYDADGNSDLVTDPALHVTDNDYDPLHRLSRTLQDVGGIAANTQFQYDAIDNLTQVTDPNGLITHYGYDGLGNLTSLSSPDTGGTSYTYDVAGNRKAQTDSRGTVTNYGYDALNRWTTTTYATPSLNVTASYDTVNAVCPSPNEIFAVGRLTKLTMGDGNSTQYCYNRFGYLVRKVETINGKTFNVRYALNFAGRLNGVTYPDGAVVDYAHDAAGRVIEVGFTPAGGTRRILLTNISYYPFGPAKQWTYGNGRVMKRTFDLDYRPSSIADAASGGLSLGYTFNSVGNLTELRDASQAGPPKVTFGYDAFNRLTDFLDGPTGAMIEHYAYDATGNRTLFQDSSGSQSYSYVPGTHHLGQVGNTVRSYDAVGNTTVIDSVRSYTYSDANRMDSAKKNGVVAMNFRYNGKGERVQFVTPAGTTQTHTVYDESGHWIGDFDSTGKAFRQAIWLDDLPVGLLNGAGTSQKLVYVEADALGTPRAVIDPDRNVAIWNWDLKGEAFGNSAPNQDPDLDGVAFPFNLRFPGQQYNGGSELYYNYFRDYDAGTGRYMEADPLGLRAGPTLYGYADSDPVFADDPYGLQRVASSHTWRPNAGGFSASQSRVPYTPPGVNIPLSLDVHNSTPSFWEAAANGLSPWDYNRYCTDVWCMQRRTPTMCSASDSLQKQFYVGGLPPTAIEVARMGCKCRKLKFREELSHDEESAGFLDWVELLSRQIEAGE